jgi:hypothetical protein
MLVLFRMHFWLPVAMKGLCPKEKVDEFVFYKGKKTVLLFCEDDGILCGSSSNDIYDIITSPKGAFNITDEGVINDYLGIQVTRPTKDIIKLQQPHLIQQILDEVGMLSQSKTKEKAAPPSTILRQDLDGNSFQEKWDYCCTNLEAQLP